VGQLTVGSNPTPSAETARTLPGVDRVQLDELMGVALDEARAAAEHDDVPIGAVVARGDTGEVVAGRHNQREQDTDPTAHAEILALRDAARRAGSWRLDGCALVVTLEPCPMCAGAAVAARLGLVAFGAADPKAGALGSLYNLAADPRLNHEATVVDGVRADECAALLTAFFADRR
jgi:tRNA(adenine34) deaminase